MNKKILKILVIFFCIALFSAPNPASANNLQISNVSLGERNPGSDTVTIDFDVSWENSWKTKINHDAVWLTVRLHSPSVSPTNKKLCQLTQAGLNPSGTATGSNANLELYVPSDKTGAFLRPKSYGTYSSVESDSIQLTIDYDSCGFSDNDSVYASVFGIEMIYIPEGAFYAGDDATSTASLVQGSADDDPWYISSASVISVSNPASNGYRYVSAGNAGENSTGASFSISSSFPKGYSAFYTMKYEITEGQWVEFVNSLGSAAARSNRDLTNSSHKNSDSVRSRNTISCSGSPLICTTDRPARAVSYLTWMDLAAFLDWAALRPMTELEFEKAARGPLLPEGGEFAWGTTDITAAAAISGSFEDGTETITTSGANAHYNNVTLTGGDTVNGAEYAKGPLRVGIFATSSSGRVSAGASYYGIMEFSGNVRERVVTIGNADGRDFLGSHGDGTLTTTSGYEGNADEGDWPGMNALTQRGVTGAEGSGFRGGGWDNQSSGDRLRISDRAEAAQTSASAFNNSGGRGVRTYDGQ